MPKIPPHAKCVFKGVIFDVYQWEQKLYDGSMEIFEMLKRKPNVQVLALSDENVFYLEEEQPFKGRYRGLVGGSAKSYDEDPLDIAKRELLEETGMVAKKWVLLSSSNHVPKTDWDFYLYVAYGCEKIQEPVLDSGEKVEVKKMSLDLFLRDIAIDPKFHSFELRRAFLDIDLKKQEELKTWIQKNSI